MDLAARFLDYLQKQKLSEASVRNYLSDINRFLAWSAKSPHLGISASVFTEYYRHLLKQNLPASTFNRYLVSLRQFGQFLYQNKIVDQDLTKELATLSRNHYQTKEQILTDFGASLEKEGLSQATVKNYLVDISQFLDWLES
jgi:site-specific recombinase XerD